MIRISRLGLFRTPQRGPLRVLHTTVVAALFVTGLWFTAMPAYPYLGYADVTRFFEASPRELVIVFLCSLLGVTLFIIAFNKAVDRMLGKESDDRP